MQENRRLGIDGIFYLKNYAAILQVINPETSLERGRASEQYCGFFFNRKLNRGVGVALCNPAMFSCNIVVLSIFNNPQEGLKWGSIKVGKLEVVGIIVRYGERVLRNLISIIKKYLIRFVGYMFVYMNWNTAFAEQKM